MPVAELAIDRRAITAQLAAAVREAGAMALKKFRSPFKSWTKHGSSPVSEVDMAVDELLRERLGRSKPAFAWLSEESIDDPVRLDARRVWIVDPIDGTRAFISGLDDWAVSAALSEDGRPIAAALFAPVEDRLYLATAGGGTTLNGVAVVTGTDVELDGTRVAGPKRRLDAFVALRSRIEALPKVNSLALRVARVASGDIDISIAGPNSHDWDLAAADLVVEEAGGALTTLDGQKPIYNRADPVHPTLVAAGRARHAVLLQWLQGQRAAFE